jgi:hypothetical protein
MWQKRRRVVVEALIVCKNAKPKDQIHHSSSAIFDMLLFESQVFFARFPLSKIMWDF